MEAIANNNHSGKDEGEAAILDPNDNNANGKLPDPTVRDNSDPQNDKDKLQNEPPPPPQEKKTNSSNLNFEGALKTVITLAAGIFLGKDGIRVDEWMVLALFFLSIHKGFWFGVIWISVPVCMHYYGLINLYLLFPSPCVIYILAGIALFSLWLLILHSIKKRKNVPPKVETTAVIIVAIFGICLCFAYAVFVQLPGVIPQDDHRCLLPYKEQDQQVLYTSSPHSCPTKLQIEIQEQAILQHRQEPLVLSEIKDRLWDSLVDLYGQARQLYHAYHSILAYLENKSSVPLFFVLTGGHGVGKNMFVERVAESLNQISECSKTQYLDPAMCLQARGYFKIPTNTLQEGNCSKVYSKLIHKTVSAKQRGFIPIMVFDELQLAPNFGKCLLDIANGLIDTSDSMDDAGPLSLSGSIVFVTINHFAITSIGMQEADARLRKFQENYLDNLSLKNDSSLNTFHTSAWLEKLLSETDFGPRLSSFLMHGVQSDTSAILSEKTIILPFFYHNMQSIVRVLQHNFESTMKRHNITIVYNVGDPEKFFQAIYTATYSHLSDSHKVSARIAAVHAINLASDFLKQLNLADGSRVVVAAMGDCFSAVDAATERRLEICLRLGQPSHGAAPASAPGNGECAAGQCK